MVLNGISDLSLSSHSCVGRNLSSSSYPGREAQRRSPMHAQGHTQTPPPHSL